MSIKYKTNLFGRFSYALKKKKIIKTLSSIEIK